MAFRHGKRTGVAVEAEDLTTYLNDSTASHEVETSDVTTYGRDAMEYIVGQRDGSISLEGIFDGDADAIDDELHSRLAVEDGAHVLVQQGYASSDGVGLRCNFCKGEAISYEVSAPVDDVVAVSFEAQADGGLFGGVTLHDPDAAGVGFEDAVAGATVDNTSVDDRGASTSNGFVAQLHVLSNDLDGDLVVTVEDSSDDSTFATLGTFSTVGSATTTAEQITGTGTVERYVRINIDTSAAASGSAVIAVGFARLPDTVTQVEE